MKAALYLRVSTDDQDTQRQIETTTPYCEKKGYKIVETYKDQGISGWKHHERPEFIRLLQDAEAGKFDVIVADASSRFSRQDEGDFFELVAPRFRRAGVILDTVYDGVMDFNEFSGFLLTAVKSNQNNQFSKTTSHNVLSGSMTKAKDGRNMGSVPYGYRSAMDEPGNPKSPHHLEIYEPEAEIVRWLFEQYAHHDVPIRHLCKQLNSRGVPSPGGAQYGWLPGTIRRILTNRKYTGIQTYGKTARGRFHRNIDGKLTPYRPKPKPPDAEKNKHDLHKNPEESWIVAKPKHDHTLITSQLFELVQSKLAENRGKNRKPTGIGGFKLSSMVVCGCCGKTMYAKANHGKNRKSCIYYQCKNETGQCGYISVREDWIMDRIHLMLQERMFKPEVVERHIAELSRRIEETKVQVDPKRIEKLQSEIKAANKNILFLPDDLRPDALEGIRERQAELEQLQAQIQNDIDAAALFQRTVERIEQGAESYRQWLQKYRIIGRETEPKEQFAAMEAEAGNTRHRAAVHSWLKRITIFWKHTPTRKYKLLGMECETQWADVQKWPLDVANLYLRVLLKARRTASGFMEIRRPCSRRIGSTSAAQPGIAADASPCRQTAC